VKEIFAIMKEILWISMREENSSHVEMCIGFVYNALQNLCRYNPNFTTEVEREINELRDLHPNSEFLRLGGML
jgi:hypothetical protein